jgi:hypothetical protein
MSPRDYDSTVARIAGNILSGYGFSNFKGDTEPTADTRYELDVFDLYNVSAAVALARAIVAETKRTEHAKP